MSDGALQGDWQMEGPADVNFLRQQLVKGCHFPPAVYEAVSGQLIQIITGKFGEGKSQKPPTKRMVYAIGRLLDQMRRTDIAAFTAIAGKVTQQLPTVHIHQGTEVHVAAAVVCPPEVSEKLRALPDDTLRAIADMTLEEETDDDCPEQPGAD